MLQAILLVMNTLCLVASPHHPNYLAMTSALLPGAAACVAVGAVLPARRANAMAMVTCGGSGNPLQPHRPFRLAEPEYKLLIQPKLPQYASIFGLHVRRSSFTWESGIYVRSDR